MPKKEATNKHCNAASEVKQNKFNDEVSPDEIINVPDDGVSKEENYNEHHYAVPRKGKSGALPDDVLKQGNTNEL